MSRQEGCRIFIKRRVGHAAPAPAHVHRASGVTPLPSSHAHDCQHLVRNDRHVWNALAHTAQPVVLPASPLLPASPTLSCQHSRNECMPGETWHRGTSMHRTSTAHSPQARSPSYHSRAARGVAAARWPHHEQHQHDLYTPWVAPVNQSSRASECPTPLAGGPAAAPVPCCSVLGDTNTCAGREPAAAGAAVAGRPAARRMREKGGLWPCLRRRLCPPAAQRGLQPPTGTACRRAARLPSGPGAALRRGSWGSGGWRCRSSHRPRVAPHHLPSHAAWRSAWAGCIQGGQTPCLQDRGWGPGLR